MSDTCCQGTLDAAELEGRQRRVLLVVLAVNAATFLLMVAGSWLSGSSALLSGTLDNLGDALTYALSFAVVGAASSAKAKVAFVKGLLILAAAIGVAVHIGWRLTHLEVPLAGVMAGAAGLNLLANAVCFWLLTPHRNDDVNMASVWECSRNDLFDGTGVVATAGLVWLFDSAWPDVLVAAALLGLFARSAWRVLADAWREIARRPRQRLRSSKGFPRWK